MKFTRFWIVPIVFGAMVLVLGTTLIAIGARSPYTHLNRNVGPTASYTRTDQTLVGTPVSYVPPGLASGVVRPSDQVALGADLFVADGCASCHGINGTGGVFAPPVGGFEVATLARKTHSGPGGMPAFADLPQADLDAIAAFLNTGPAAAAASATPTP